MTVETVEQISRILDGESATVVRAVAEGRRVSVRLQREAEAAHLVPTDADWAAGARLLLDRVPDYDHR